MIAPLSSCQQRVWRLVGTPSDRALFERVGFRLLGTLSVVRVAAALGEVCERHTVLRSAFFVFEGHAMQWVRAARCVPLLADLQGLPAAAREAAALRLARRDQQPPFDPARGPLMRVAILRMAPEDHVLLLAAHHLIFDGESRAILVRELGLLLRAPDGRRVPLPELPIQYGDFARRERSPAAVAHRTRRVNALAARLGALPPPVTLPPDRPRPACGTRRGRTASFAVRHATLRTLRAASAAEDVSFFMLLLAALAIVLRRAGGQDEVTVGVPVANRTSVDVERLIGPFVNILPIRLMTSCALTVGGLVESTRASMLDAFADRDLPFDAVLRALHPGQPLDSYGPAGGTPVFRVCVSYSEGDAADRLAGAIPGLTVRSFEAEDVMAGCDLFVAFVLGRRALTGTAVYSAELFDPATVTRFIDALQTVLGTLYSDWNLPLSSLGSRSAPLHVA